MCMVRINKPIDNEWNEIPLNCVVMVIDDKSYIVNTETGEIYD